MSTPIEGSGIRPHLRKLSHVVQAAVFVVDSLEAAAFEAVSLCCLLRGRLLGGCFLSGCLLAAFFEAALWWLPPSSLRPLRLPSSRVPSKRLPPLRPPLAAFFEAASLEAASLLRGRIPSEVAFVEAGVLGGFLLGATSFAAAFLSCVLRGSCRLLLARLASSRLPCSLRSSWLPLWRLPPLRLLLL